VALTKLLVALKLPMPSGAAAPGVPIATKEQALEAIVHLAVPCAEKQLLKMGIAAGEIETLTGLALAAAADETRAKAAVEAARPLARGEFTETTLTLLVALEVPVHDGKAQTELKITTKEQAVAELVRLVAPWMSRKLTNAGVAADDVVKAVKATERAATHASKATALCRALLPLMQGETSETTAMGVIVALELTDGKGALIRTKEQVAIEAVHILV
jgi:hypothetical protein